MPNPPFPLPDLHRAHMPLRVVEWRRRRDFLTYSTAPVTVVTVDCGGDIDAQRALRASEVNAPTAESEMKIGYSLVTPLPNGPDDDIPHIVVRLAPSWVEPDGAITVVASTRQSGAAATIDVGFDLGPDRACLRDLIATGHIAVVDLNHGEINIDFNTARFSAARDGAIAFHLHHKKVGGSR